MIVRSLGPVSQETSPISKPWRSLSQFHKRFVNKSSFRIPMDPLLGSSAVEIEEKTTGLCK